MSHIICDACASVRYYTLEWLWRSLFWSHVVRASGLMRKHQGLCEACDSCKLQVCALHSKLLRFQVFWWKPTMFILSCLLHPVNEEAKHRRLSWCFCYSRLLPQHFLFLQFMNHFNSWLVLWNWHKLLFFALAFLVLLYFAYVVPLFAPGSGAIPFVHSSFTWRVLYSEDWKVLLAAEFAHFPHWFYQRFSVKWKL